MAIAVPSGGASTPTRARARERIFSSFRLLLIQLAPAAKFAIRDTVSACAGENQKEARVLSRDPYCTKAGLFERFVRESNEDGRILPVTRARGNREIRPPSSVPAQILFTLANEEKEESLVH